MHLSQLCDFIFLYQKTTFSSLRKSRIKQQGFSKKFCEYMYGWMVGGGKSRFKNCLQQSKNLLKFKNHQGSKLKYLRVTFMIKPNPSSFFLKYLQKQLFDD